ncbi:MAG: NPCBM/NEW2 domain-containing protein [Armatimonadetes bacterium]|nr:NPCBM/NEW2 domain-containing protein [Armatimonadota bacterium]
MVALTLALVAPLLQPIDTCSLSDLDLSKMTVGWGKVRVGRSIEDKPLTVGGKVYTAGIGTHAASRLRLRLDGKATSFRCLIGVDDETQGRGSIRVRVYLDGKVAFDSGTLKGGAPPAQVDLKLGGVKDFILVASGANDGIDYDHVDFIEPTFTFSGARPAALGEPDEKEVILTPPPPKSPRLNTAPVIGCTPGKPFLYRIPATGVRPMRFSAQGLPKGLILDASTGFLSGRTPAQKGTYRLRLSARNAKGLDQKSLSLKVGDTLALTPPMGWNSWYIHYGRVTDKAMRAAADAMVKSGMADFGYQYVNIDDCWPRTQREAPLRDESGTVLCNDKFPDMPALTSYIHSKGLLAGIYTSPGPWTCAGFTGAWQHERQDTETFARWGFDFLKYDWCSYENVATGTGIERLKKPYAQMGEILKGLDRDVVYNLCQYGMGDVWKWGAETRGNCWRTTGDLGNMSSWRDVAFANARLWPYAKPGHWNDPDYLLIGWIGDSSPLGRRKCTIPPAEQYSYMGMWCLMAAPLIFSGDMERLDPFTLSVLCNAEMISVDQDPLGRQAKVLRATDEEWVLQKPLADGSTAIGLFNFGEVERTVSATWKELGYLSGKKLRVRDLWRQKDIRTISTGLYATLKPGACLVVRVWE